MMTREPEEILDEPHEQIMQRVCAIDVGKDSGKVCVRLPAESGSGRRVSKVWDVPARTKAVIDLGDHLACQGIQKVTVESTSDYWRIWFYLLEARGLDVQLVNARDVKNVPGRPKTDKLDSVWLAKLTEKGLLRPSFVPPKQIRVLRDYTRLRVDLTAERTRHWQRLEKLLEDALIKISAVTSRNGANKSPVASSDPHCGTTNRDNSRGASPSLTMTTQPSHPPRRHRGSTGNPVR